MALKLSTLDGNKEPLLNILPAGLRKFYESSADASVFKLSGKKPSETDSSYDFDFKPSENRFNFDFKSNPDLFKYEFKPYNFEIPYEGAEKLRVS